jgi:hypothetical protein
MNITNELHEPAEDDDLEMQKSVIRQSLDEIANDIGIKMRETGLNYPLGLAVPSLGQTIVTMVTTADDVSDFDWSQASAIVRDIVGKRLGGIRLRSRHLPCAMANAPMKAADIITNALEFDTRL